MDISKAFDTVPHSLLLHKLEKLGFRGGINEWLESYFSNREQFVQINYFDPQDATKKKVCSETKIIPSGTFQGTTTGPDFFNIHLNDLFSNLEVDSDTDSLSTGYADDLTSCNAADNLDELFRQANTKLKELNS